MGSRSITVVAIACVLITACQQRNPLDPGPGPAAVRPLDGFVGALRDQGFNVTLAEQIPPHQNHFFSVPAQSLVVNDARVNAFEYPTVEAAAADAALVRPDGQPNPRAIIDWISTPRFYRQERLIVLYVGCSPDVIRALDRIMGRAFVTGDMPCSRVFG